MPQSTFVGAKCFWNNLVTLFNKTIFDFACHQLLLALRPDLATACALGD